jgi:hypothetical protein
MSDGNLGRQNNRRPATTTVSTRKSVEAITSRNPRSSIRKCIEMPIGARLARRDGGVRGERSGAVHSLSNLVARRAGRADRFRFATKHAAPSGQSSSFSLPWAWRFVNSGADQAGLSGSC